MRPLAFMGRTGGWRRFDSSGAARAAVFEAAAAKGISLNQFIERAIEHEVMA